MVESKEQNLDSCRKSRISPSLNKMLWFLQWRFKCYQKKKKKFMLVTCSCKRTFNFTNVLDQQHIGSYSGAELILVRHKTILK